MSKLYHPVLPDKISVNKSSFYRLFYGRKTFNDIFHIIHQSSYSLHTFCILFCISSLVAVKLVPVLRAYHNHGVHQEIHVHPAECRRVSASSGHCDSSHRLIHHQLWIGIKQTGKKRIHLAAYACVINRTHKEVSVVITGYAHEVVHAVFRLAESSALT